MARLPLDVGSEPRRMPGLEIWEVSDDGPSRFCHTVVFEVRYDAVLQMKTTRRQDAGSLTEAERNGATRIPFAELWPKPTEGMKQYMGEMNDRIHIKGPDLSTYAVLDQITESAAEALLREMATLETVQSQHDHVAPYLGYTAGDDGLIRGLCFPSYRETLQDRSADATRPLDLDRCMREIRSGVQFLHDQGLVHNDLNADNIMFDDEDRAVIIDFDSCRPHGAKIARKPGNDLSAERSDFEHDHQALRTLERRLRELTPEERSRSFHPVTSEICK